MKIKINSWLFLLAMLAQLQIDLLLLNFGLQGLLCTIILLLVYVKQRQVVATTCIMSLFFIEKFCTIHKLGLDILLILFIFFLSNVFKKNIAFKGFVYYLLLIIYLFLHSLLTNIYFFDLTFPLKATLIQIIINIAWATIIKPIYISK